MATATATKTTKKPARGAAAQTKNVNAAIKPPYPTDGRTIRTALQYTFYSLNKIQIECQSFFDLVKSSDEI